MRLVSRILEHKEPKSRWDDRDPDRPFRPLIVGESDPNGRSQDEVLLPTRSKKDSGWRLCSLILGLRPETYEAMFDRMNLFEYVPNDPWNASTHDQARANVCALREVFEERDVVILLGQRVARAFDIVAEDPIVRRSNLIAIPHPSARSRAWHRPGIVERVRHVLREECHWIPFGEAL